MLRYDGKTRSRSTRGQQFDPKFGATVCKIYALIKNITSLSECGNKTRQHGTNYNNQNNSTSHRNHKTFININKKLKYTLIKRE